ncbi:MAG TPA: class I SAM-dependent methyltransferase [Candidatus Coprovivens excrementavium]|nr:class I SAM-dependent methyltransferase [Candidatus Coprovivens excrementavium]
MEQYFTNNPDLKSELRTIIYKNKSQTLTFYSDNGVFSKDKLDFGSTLLLETVLKNVNTENLNILDVGCGYGFLGISLAKFLNAHVTMCDINKRALHLAKRNCEKNNVKSLCEVLESNIYENITNIYDLIITNPPIRAGKEVVYGILDGARDYLKEDGELWMVIRKNQGAKSTIEHLKNNYECEIVTKSKGFYIIKAKKH